ncbi:MAG: peptidylprolyl isomerase [Deltaproteobacteria bacterium]|nr:MAG: peptidylprolyl isomerase [Deltaproteobacteria bacterium]
MSKVKSGDTVKVHYTGKLENGDVFDSSREQEPFEFTVGNKAVIPGFEKGVVGMEVGDTKTIEIPPEEAYGAKQDELVVEVKKSEFPDDITPSIGQRLQIKQQNGNPIVVTITDLTEDSITLDANHPLAGYTLFFDVEVVDIA